MSKRTILLLCIFLLSWILYSQTLDVMQINQSPGRIECAGEEAIRIANGRLYLTYYQYTENTVKVMFACSDDQGSTFQFTEIDEMTRLYEYETLNKPVLEVLADGSVIIAYLKIETRLNNLYKAVSDINAANFEIGLLAVDITDEVHLLRQNDVLTITYQSCDSLQAGQFSFFQHFTDKERTMNDADESSSGFTYFWGWDVLHGPVHSNTDIWIRQVGGGNNDGWPTFYDRVTTSGIFQGTAGPLVDSGAPLDQIFQGPEPAWQEHVDPIELPVTVENYPEEYLFPFDGLDADIVFVKMNTYGYESYIGRYEPVRIDSFNVYSWYPHNHAAAQDIIDNGGNWFTDAEHIWTNYVPISELQWTPGPAGSATGRSIYIDGATLWIEGEVYGKQTWVCSEDIYITDDIYYSHTPPGAAPDITENPNRIDFFGLVSEKKIYIKYKHRDPVSNEIMEPNCDDIYLYGAYAALGLGDTLLYGNQACHHDGLFSFEYQHPHGSTPDFSSISPFTGNDTVYTFIDLHKYIFPDTMVAQTNLQGFLLHGNWPPTSLPCGYPHEADDYIDSYPNNGNGNPGHEYHYPYGTDYPWYNPVWPESAAEIVFERGYIRTFNSLTQRRRGFSHRSGSDPYNHNGNEWDIENQQYDGGHPSTGYGKDLHFDRRLKFNSLPNFPYLDPAYHGRKMKVLTSLNGGQDFSTNFEYDADLPAKPHRAYLVKNSQKLLLALQTGSHLLQLFISTDNGVSYPEYSELTVDDPNSFYFEQVYLTEDNRLYLLGKQTPWNYNHLYAYDLDSGILSEVDYGSLLSCRSDFTLSRSEARVYADITGSDHGYIEGIEVLYSADDDILDSSCSWILESGNEDLYREEADFCLVFNENDSLYFFLNAAGSTSPDRNLYLMKAGLPGISPQTEAEIPSVVASLHIQPNPFNRDILITIRSSESGRSDDLTVDIFNLKGQKITTLPCQAESTAGRYVATWPGTDRNGQPVGSGIYYAQTRIAGKVLFRKITLIK